MSNEIPTAVREALKKRDLKRCLVCMAYGSDIHHRVRRRDGGHGLANCVTLCRTDHSRAHANPQWAREMGIIVPSWDDPEQVPLRSYRGWILLRADGTTTFLTAADTPLG